MAFKLDFTNVVKRDHIFETHRLDHLAPDEESLLDLIKETVAERSDGPYTKVDSNKIMLGPEAGVLHNVIKVHCPNPIRESPAITDFLTATSPFDIFLLLSRLDYFRWLLQREERIAGQQAIDDICRMREALVRIADGCDDPTEVAQNVLTDSKDNSPKVTI